MKSPNPRGRPAKPTEERRSEKVDVKLREDEKALLERAAAASGASMGDILRKGGLPLAESIVEGQSRKRVRRRSS